MLFKIFFLTFLYHLNTASATSTKDRNFISNKIQNIYTSFCKKEDLKQKIKAKFDLAQIYVMHGEYNEMKKHLLLAAKISKNKSCTKKINDFLN